MLKKIGQKTLIRFGFFLIIWWIIFFVTSIFNSRIFGYNSKQNLFNLFVVFLMFPNYIIHIIQNIDKLNLFDAYYFWGGLDSRSWSLFFWVLAGLYFSLVLTLLRGDNDRIKNKIMHFHFWFFTYALILRTVLDYFRNPQDPNFTITIGSNNLLVVLGDFSVIATNIYILTRIKKEVDIKFLKNTIKKYIFTISELLIVLYITLTFYNYLLSPDASMIDHVSYRLDFLFFGFFLFLCLQLIRIRFNGRP